jgi:hypothetical protein
VGVWHTDWCARLAPLNNIGGLAWGEGDRLTVEVKIWDGNVNLCRGMQMKNLQYFKETVAWTLPNLRSCLEVKIGEDDADEESVSSLCNWHKSDTHPDNWDWRCRVNLQ